MDSRHRGNRSQEATATWPPRAIEAGKGPDMKTSVEWLYRSVIGILLGVLVYTFQKTDKKVDDLADRVPRLEIGLGNVQQQQKTQGDDIKSILGWVNGQPYVQVGEGKPPRKPKVH